MKAVVLAYRDLGCAGLETLLEAGVEVLAVFTHRDDSASPVAASVADLATSRGLLVYAPDDINHPMWVNRIRALAPDVLFAFSYGRLVQQEILDIPPLGCLNVHPSLLPRYRGLSPVSRALLNGETTTGVTLHFMGAGKEDGDIVAQRSIQIADTDDLRSLSDKAVQATREILRATLPALQKGNVTRRAQDSSAATTYGPLKEADYEIKWSESSSSVRNAIRALTKPFCGAFTFRGDTRCFVWSARAEADTASSERPGTVLSVDPLRIACGDGALEILSGQTETGVCVSGVQLAQELNLVPGLILGRKASSRLEDVRKKRVLILGVNGFIGNALAERLLDSGRYEVHGMDLRSNYLTHLLGRPGFHFFEGDIAVHREWIEYQVKSCDVVLPLVAIATPIEYTRNPLRVFELDFEENLRIVRYCAKYGKRIVFPSTSEVYGMCDDEEFDEDNSRLITGPICMQRWIYSCSKQLLDRVIWAYGEKEGLNFTLFRPFNWIGPKLDSLTSARIGSSRAITQLILNLVEGTPIQLIDGGSQCRCFTDLSDGIEALFRIIENKDGRCDGKIINIGNPENELSIRGLAEMLIRHFEAHPLRSHFPPLAGMRETESGSYYGRGYQDVQHRRPSIRNAKRYLDWSPVVSMDDSVKRTLDFFLQQAAESGEFVSEPLVSLIEKMAPPQSIRTGAGVSSGAAANTLAQHKA